MDIAIIILVGITGSLFTFLVNNKWQFGGVLASAGVTVVANGFLYFYPESLNLYLTTHLPFVIMGSSFIGMANSRTIRDYRIVGVSGLFFCIIYLLSGTFYEGYGGSLGTTAAIALCSASALNQLKIKNVLFRK